MIPIARFVVFVVGIALYAYACVLISRAALMRYYFMIVDA